MVGYIFPYSYPKNEPKGDQITVYVTNLTAPDGQVSLADSYVVWAEETPMSNDIYTPAWIPTGMPARLSSDVLSTKSSMRYMTT